MIALINKSGVFLFNNTIEEVREFIKNKSKSNNMVGWLFMDKTLVDTLLRLPIRKCLIDTENSVPFECNVSDFINKYEYLLVKNNGNFY